MIKVVRIPLISSTMYTDGSEVPYKDICKILWTLQNQTRTIKNKTVQLLWEWNNFSSDYKKEHGEYPKEKDILNYSFNGFAYDRLKHESDMNTMNFTCTLREAQKQFKAHLKDYIKGDRSILEYKSNQPLELHNKAIKLDYENKQFIFCLGLCNKDFAKQNNINTQLTFMASVKDKSQKTILERCYDGEYKISASRLIYDKKKKMWCINLCYSFENANLPTLDKDKILGVDLGVAKPIVASVSGEYNRLIIDGGEIEHIRNKTEKRKKSLLKASTICGDGRKGHGYNTRVKPVLDIGDKIARCRDTINHKYSRALIDYAVKNGCGTIQMEDLKGVTKKANRFLQNWSYFDLQTKIEYKAKEQGISVIYINPHYTSQRCSKCGFIHEGNRPEQARFKCQNCGFEENADYNASQNIAVRDIDKIISVNMKQT
jgi:IS605 OrfB family transposase